MKRLFFLLAVIALAASASASISRTGSVAAAATSGTFSATATGDLKLIFAYRSASVTPPSLPSGWTTVTTKATATGGVVGSYRIGCKVASSSGDTTTGTWTNASAIAGISYAGTTATTTAACNVSGVFHTVGAIAQNTAKTSTSLNYPSMTGGGAMGQVTGTSWVVGFAGASTGVCTPTGMTSVASAGAGPAAGVVDTNAGVTGWSSTSCTISSGTWMTALLEIEVPVCSGQAYGNITCVQAPPQGANVATCGTSYYSSFQSVTAGDRLIGLAGNAGTGVTDTEGNTWVPLGNLTNTAWSTGGAATDGAWTTIVGSTASGTYQITVACPSGVYEWTMIELHSSVGTVGIDCSSSFATVSTGAISSNCTASSSGKLGVTMVDYNSQPNAGSGWTAVVDGGTELVFALQTVSGAGTITGAWTDTANFMISGTAVFTDGSAGGATQTPTLLYLGVGNAP